MYLDDYAMFKLSENSKKNREGIDQRLIEIDDLAITLTVIDYGHHSNSGLRTAEVQHDLFLQNLSKCDGYEIKSKHQSGKALDFYAYVDGKVSWDPGHLAQVACAYFRAAMILGYKIKWGGLFKPNGWDKPHIELDE